MQWPEYYTVEQMLNMIDEPNRAACLRLYRDNERLFREVQGSTHNHQAWRGGYHDHVQEIMNIAVVLYYTLYQLRALPFSVSDLLLVVFLHDVEKPWKYELGEDGQLRHKASMQTKDDHQAFRMTKLAEYGIVLSAEHENGLKYAEGELDDYSPRQRMMGPLAAVAHMCDVASARLWFNHPYQHECDVWTGKERCIDS